MLLRSRDPKALAAFYRHQFGIPELRNWPGGHMLWAGTYTVIETNVLGEGTPDQGAEHPEQCDVMPIYAAAAPKELNAVVMAIGEQSLACYKDLDGNWFGIRDTQPGQKVVRRLSDGTELPERFAGLVGLVYRSPDPQSQRAEFERVFGSEQRGFETYFLPGHPQRISIETRLDVQRVAIPRVYGFEEFADRARAAGWSVRDELTFKGGHLNYYVDGQGQLMGFQERKSYDPEIETTQMPEDVDARFAFDGIKRAPD